MRDMLRFNQSDDPKDHTAKVYGDHTAMMQLIFFTFSLFEDEVPLTRHNFAQTVEDESSRPTWSSSDMNEFNAIEFLWKLSQSFLFDKTFSCETTMSCFCTTSDRCKLLCEWNLQAVIHSRRVYLVLNDDYCKHCCDWRRLVNEKSVDRFKFEIIFKTKSLKEFQSLFWISKASLNWSRDDWEDERFDPAKGQR